MQLRSAAKLAGVACLAALLPMLMGPTGGYPSQPTFQSVTVTGAGIQTPFIGLGRAPSSGVTKLVADNGGSGDTELVSQTTTAGNAQFRAVNLGGVNWSFGNNRATNQFNICAAATLTGTCVIFDSAAVMQAGSVPDARLSANVALKNTTANVFQAAGNTNIQAKAGAAANLGQIQVVGSGGVNTGGFCLSDTANICETAIGAGVTDLFASSAGIQFDVGGVNQGIITTSSVPWVTPSGSTIGTRLCGPSNTTTNLTTTLAAASGMTVTVPTSGGYLLDLFVEFAATTTGTQGFKFNFGGTSPGGAETGGYGENGFVNGAVQAVGEVSALSTVTSFATVDTGLPNDWIKVNGIYQTLAAGTVIFQFAENSASANGVRVLQGSYICITRIQ